MFGKIMDHWLTHAVILSLVIGALFVGYKAGASYLPDNGVGGTLKHIVNGF